MLVLWTNVKQRGNNLKHIRIHHAKKTLSCIFCENKFKDKRIFIKHIKIYHAMFVEETLNREGILKIM